MIFGDANRSSIGTVIVLAKISVGVWCQAWVLHGAVNTYKVALAERATSVRWNRTTLLTQAADVSSVETTVGSWFWESGFLYVRATSGQSVFENTIQAVVSLSFSMPDPRLVDGVQYFPRILSVPNLSQRIEAYFGGVGQVGGGSMSLENSDGYFDDKEGWQWDGGRVEIWCGMDIANASATDGDYEQVATWIVEDWSRTRDEFTLRLKEPKAKIKAQIPTQEFTREDYGNIEDSIVGQPIPMAYGSIIGAKPTLIDPGSKRFKLASHPITSLNGVRIKSDTTQEFTKKLKEFSASYYGGGEPLNFTFRTYFPGVNVKSFSHPTRAWTKKDSIKEVQGSSYAANTQFWYYSEGWIYFSCGGLDQVGETLVSYEIGSSGWNSLEFKTVDLANAEFTLGDGWTVGGDLSVDFVGKPNSDGVPIDNAPDVIKDILESVGETDFDSASFGDISGEKTKLKLGKQDTRTVYRRALSLYITKKKDVLTQVGEINSVCGTYVYTNSTGQYACGVWDPFPQSVDPLNSANIIEFSESDDTQQIVTKTIANYKVNSQEKIKQSETRERQSTQYVRDQANPIIEERDLPFFFDRDAIDWASQTLFMRSQPLRKLNVTVPWTYILGYNLGGVIPVKLTEKRINQTFEIIERTIDFNRKQVRFVLGDMRGIGNKMGWWTYEPPTLPTSFAGLAGYGSGSIDWNGSWAQEIKDWARNNYGYWTDDNGFAVTSDAESFNVSNWI